MSNSPDIGTRPGLSVQELAQCTVGATGADLTAAGVAAATGVERLAKVYGATIA